MTHPPRKVDPFRSLVGFWCWWQHLHVMVSCRRLDHLSARLFNFELWYWWSIAWNAFLWLNDPLCWHFALLVKGVCRLDQVWISERIWEFLWIWGNFTHRRIVSYKICPLHHPCRTLLAFGITNNETPCTRRDDALLCCQACILFVCRYLVGRWLRPMLSVLAFEILRLLTAFHAVVLNRDESHLDFGALVLGLGWHGLGRNELLDLARVSRALNRQSPVRHVLVCDPLLFIGLIPLIQAVPAVSLHEKGLSLPL